MHKQEGDTAAMPQMFDWIFYAIMLPVPILLLWDWMRTR